VARREGIVLLLPEVVQFYQRISLVIVASPESSQASSVRLDTGGGVAKEGGMLAGVAYGWSSGVLQEFPQH
jgi:hypothetical protein